MAPAPTVAAVGPAHLRGGPARSVPARGVPAVVLPEGPPRLGPQQPAGDAHRPRDPGGPQEVAPRNPRFRLSHPPHPRSQTLSPYLNLASSKLASSNNKISAAKTQDGVYGIELRVHDLRGHQNVGALRFGGGLPQGHMEPWGDGRGLDQGRLGAALGVAGVGHQHAGPVAGDGPRALRALPGGFADGARAVRGVEAGETTPPYRDLFAGAPRVRLAGGARGGGAAGARSLRRVHRAAGGVSGPSRTGSARRPHPDNR